VKKLRISIVQYLNTAPLVWGFTHGPLQGKYDLSFTVPSRCADDLRTGRADVAIIPAIELQRIDDLVVLPNFAIASKDRVRSLLIVSHKSAKEITSIALDRGSRSTQALTQILCAVHWKISPRFFEAAPDVAQMLNDADAALLIGDPALRLSISIAEHAQLGPSGELLCDAAKCGIAGKGALHVYDVVQEWRRFSGLPAVLAVWAARRDAVTPEVIADFAASRSFGMAHLAEICADASQELNLPAAQLQTYLRDNIDFSLDADNLAGLDLYFRLAAKLHLIPRAKPIEWATFGDNISVSGSLTSAATSQGVIRTKDA
jgi:chorismate dehydratase